MDGHSHINLPLDLLQDSNHFLKYSQSSSLTVEVSSSYLETLQGNSLSQEVIAIQRLISLSRTAESIEINWPQNVARRVFESPNLFPLLAVALCLDNVEHKLRDEDGTSSPADIQSSRQSIYKYRLQTDFFSDTQVLLCADSHGQGRPRSLYSQKSNGLLARADFESLVDRLLAGQTALNVSSSQAAIFSQNIATIVAELFENTDIHGKTDIHGVPFKNNGIRGLVFKRVKLPQKEKRRALNPAHQISEKSVLEHPTKDLAAIEISVFDSGIGFFSSFTHQELTTDTSLEQEWRVMHRCLERHYEIDEQTSRPPHTGMGLYEVLRALKFVNGMLEVRSGRTYGYRTFLDGDLAFQLEPRSSQARPGMPKPVLLDVTRKFVTVPSAHEQLTGSSIRVLIPLH